MGSGVRQSLSWRDIRNLRIPIPPREEQDQIVRFLDWKVLEINKLINIKIKEIQELNELKIIIAKNAVTGKDKNPVVDSGNIFIGDIPATWEMWPIKHYFNIYTGATPKSGNPDFWNGDICWITPADYKTQDRYVSIGRKSITQEGYCSCGTTLVPKGSLIFSKRAPVGTVAISENEVCTSQGCLSCVLKTNDDVNYLYYVFFSLAEMFDTFSVGTTFKEISTAVFSSLKIPRPPVMEQHEIVLYLDHCFSKINRLVEINQKQIVDLEEIKKKIISDTVTGKVDVRNIEIPEYEYVGGNVTGDDIGDEETDEQEEL